MHSRECAKRKNSGTLRLTLESKLHFLTTTAGDQEARCRGDRGRVQTSDWEETMWALCLLYVQYTYTVFMVHSSVLIQCSALYKAEQSTVTGQVSTEHCSSLYSTM